MKFLTKDALLLCDHKGVVSPTASQDWVTINGRSIQVATDPEKTSHCRLSQHRCDHKTLHHHLTRTGRLL